MYKNKDYLNTAILIQFLFFGKNYFLCLHFFKKFEDSSSYFMIDFIVYSPLNVDVSNFYFHEFNDFYSFFFFIIQ